jgi:hypothetical protein
MKKFQIKIHPGTPIQVGGYTIQPIAQSISWINRHFGFVWNRPYAVKVDDGQTTHQIPIVDPTRLGLILLWGLTGLFCITAVWKSINNRRTDND